MMSQSALKIRRLRSVVVPPLLIGVLLLNSSLLALAKGPAVRHEPQQPKSGDSVRITVDFKNLTKPEEVILQYQIVDPGKYIALGDPEFKKEWVSAKLNDAGENGDKIRGDGIFSIELPPSLQTHRRLVRYRIVSPRDNKPLAPEPKDAQPNFAYFVYDGIPAWRGAINPKGSDSKLREAVTYSSNVLQKVPVYHLISRKSSVENSTWNERDGFGSRNRNEYKYTGTMVYDGIVYDHVRFRARGGSWRHAMGKNMWKFNFLSGHHFQARDDYGIPYLAKWDKLNLGACIQQGDYGMRGEQGMFEAVGFRLFNLTGLAAPKTHWVHFRIIDQAEESPADQYSGDFWGLYLATENVDENFLKEHDLPPGNVYKIEGFQGKLEFNGDRSVTNRSDVSEFIRSIMTRRQPDTWWSKNLDLPHYYNYRSIIECIHHYDLDAGKNYFFYLNPASHKWSVIPWDIDLTWGDHMFGAGQEPFYQTGLLFRPPYKNEYQSRLAEIRDLLFNTEQIGQLIDEYAAMISDPKDGPSIVAADRAKWDFHPMLVSPRVNSSKAGNGRFYFGNPRNNFHTMVQYMKTYAEKRMSWIDRSLLTDYRPPLPPKVTTEGPLNSSAQALRFQIESKPGENGIVRWRLAEITDTRNPAFNPSQPWKYEIDAIWEKEIKGAAFIEIPAKLISAGHLYRVRARQQDGTGRWSRWSSPLQFTGGDK